MSGGVRFATRPRDPLEPHLASPNRVLGGSLCAYTASPALRASCATILLCDLRPPAARALLPCFAGPFRVISQIIHFLGVLCLEHRKEGGGSKMVLRDDAEGPREAGKERTSSRRPQIAKQNRSAGSAVSARRRCVGTQLDLRAHDLAQRGEAQGGRGGVCQAKRDTPPDMSIFRHLFSAFPESSHG